MRIISITMIFPRLYGVIRQEFSRHSHDFPSATNKFLNKKNKPHVEMLIMQTRKRWSPHILMLD